MSEDILIVKRKGNKMPIKITQRVKNSYCSPNSTRIINFKNYKDLALFFHDLNDLFNAPVDKAIEEYKSGKSKVCFFS